MALMAFEIDQSVYTTNESDQGTYVTCAKLLFSSIKHFGMLEKNNYVTFMKSKVNEPSDTAVHFDSEH